MSDLDLDKEYNPVGESVHDLFDSKEEGFFVPLYQREYTWEEDNINQLFEDIIFGIRELATDDGENTTTFLGTVILTDLVDKSESVRPGEDRAQPTAVRVVIDGQQRISTISLLSIQLLELLKSLRERLPDEAPFTILLAHYNDLIESLTNLHAIRLGRGAEPSNKPKLIKARDDYWTYKGEDESYTSPVAHYTARYIRESTHSFENSSITSPQETTTRVHGNIDLINEWLDNICNAHIEETQLYDQFPTGDQIVTDRVQDWVLGFSDSDLREVIAKSEIDKENCDYFASAIYHLFLFTYYLLRRCGVNRLQPTREDWGFDMFQALNATGTPLTALETFIPQVMQAEQREGNDWLNTPSCEYIEEIEKLFETTTSNERKNSRTNALIRSFALCYDGRKLGDKFSAQRRWMTQAFEQDLNSIDMKREYVKYLAQVAAFYHDAWYMEDADSTVCIKELDTHPEGELASFLVRYLKDANSKLSAPILTRFYQQGLEDGNMDEFVEASKACAAFFTLWRSANSTSGLDSIYRQFFSGSSGSVSVGKYNWKDHSQTISSGKLKEYFNDVLRNKGVYEKEAWSLASERFLLYTEIKAICRFVLFVAGHNRTADPEHPGLTLQGTIGVCPLLNISRWNAKAYKSLEHVAPQNPPDEHRWDTAIYSENRVHEVGNLLLLPSDINTLVNRKGWDEKYIYYCYVGRSLEEKEDILSRARNEGMNLSRKALNILTKAEYSCAVDPLLTLEREGPWDAEMIRSRTAQIKCIVWEKLMSWLQ